MQSLPAGGAARAVKPMDNAPQNRYLECPDCRRNPKRPPKAFRVAVSSDITDATLVVEKAKHSSQSNIRGSE
jgi:hypothetical protein